MRLSRCCGQHGARARAPGSAVAFGKLHGLLNSKALSLPGKNVANLAMAGGSLAGAAALFTTGEPAAGVAALGATTALGGAMGAHMTASIGGGRPLRCVTVHAPHKTSTHALREALGHACLDVSTCRTRK